MSTDDGALDIRLEKGQSSQANVGASLYYWMNNGMLGGANYLTRLLGELTTEY